MHSFLRKCHFCSSKDNNKSRWADVNILKRSSLANTRVYLFHRSFCSVQYKIAYLRVKDDTRHCNTEKRRRKKEVKNDGDRLEVH